MLLVHYKWGYFALLPGRMTIVNLNLNSRQSLKNLIPLLSPFSFHSPQVLTKYIPIQCVCRADTRYNSHDSDWLILCSSEPFSQNRSFFFCIQYSNYGIQTKADYCWGLGPDNNLKKDVEIGLGSGNRRKCRLFIGFLMFGGVFQ